MRRKHLIVSLLVSCVAAVASESYTPPEDTGGDRWQYVRVYLTPIKAASQASGSAAFVCNMDETLHRVTVYVKGLTPGATYSLWLYNLDAAGKAKASARLGRYNYVKADPRGVLSYDTSLDFCVAGKYNVLSVYWQPGANPRDVKAAVPALRGDIKTDE